MIDNHQLKKLLSLSEEELRKMVSEAAKAAGADKYMTSKALSDVEKLRSMMKSLSTEQINSMLSKIGPDAANEIANRINNN